MARRSAGVPPRALPDDEAEVGPVGVDVGDEGLDRAHDGVVPGGDVGPGRADHLAAGSRSSLDQGQAQLVHVGKWR